MGYFFIFIFGIVFGMFLESRFGTKAKGEYEKAKEVFDNATQTIHRRITGEVKLLEAKIEAAKKA